MACKPTIENTTSPRPFDNVCAVSVFAVSYVLFTLVISSSRTLHVSLSMNLFCDIHTDKQLDTEAKAAIWTNVEPCIGIVCACLPTLPRLVRYWHQKIKSYSDSRSKETAASGEILNKRGSQKIKLRETAESALHSEYEELDDAASNRPRQKPVSREGGYFLEPDIALQPIEVRQSV